MKALPLQRKASEHREDAARLRLCAAALDYAGRHLAERENKGVASVLWSQAQTLRAQAITSEELATLAQIERGDE